MSRVLRPQLPPRKDQPRLHRRHGEIEDLTPGKELTVEVTRGSGETFRFHVIARVDSPIEIEYYRHGGILHYVLRGMMKAA